MRKRFMVKKSSRQIFCVLLLLFCGLSVLAQEKIVTGTIKDGSGQPLPGANILEKGTSNGTLSDFDGKFSLKVSGENSVLIISFIGFISTEITAEGSEKLNIVLQEDASALDEVVLIGYGSQKRTDVTGAIASVDIEAFRESPNVNILQSLQGSVPGIQVGQVTKAGEEPAISIRGKSTIGGNTSPLIVLDEIIFTGRIGNINPADIQSVDVLKDPSSKAIYGAQAANGVVIITTKDGSKRRYQEPLINYSVSTTTSSPTRNARLLNADEWIQKTRDTYYQDAYIGPDYTQQNPEWDISLTTITPPIQAGVASGIDYDWWDALTSPGYLENHHLSVAGATEKTSYFISGGRTKQEGFLFNDKYQRSTARINIKTDITNWLTVGAKTFGSFTDFSGVSPDMVKIITTNPFVKPRDDNGDLIIQHLGDNRINPFVEAQADDSELHNTISAVFFGVIEIPKIEGLSYRLNYGNNLTWLNNAYSSQYDAGVTGAASKSHSENYDITLDNILNYNKQFNDHEVKTTLVYGYRKVKSDFTSAKGENIDNLSLSYNSLEQAINQRINSNATEETFLYQMGRVNYSFKDRYLATATVRRDGFSGFSAKNKFGWFPSFGVGWVLSSEPFFRIPKIDFLKIRASYGQNGNITPAYSSLARLATDESSRYVFGDGASTASGQSQVSLANELLTWEKTSGLNLGIDFGIINNRITGNIEYYQTTTTDLLWERSIPQITGFSQIRSNLGKIANSGFEFSIQVNPVQTPDFSWDSNINFSTNKNKVVSLLGDDSDNNGIEDDLVASGLFIGKSLGTIYDYQIDGIWQLSDDIPSGFVPGSYRIIDQNNDGEITSADRTFLGRTEPAFRAGIQNTLSYKSFTLRFFINSLQGGKDGFLGNIHSGGVETILSNFFTMYNYWSPSNPNADYAFVNINTNPVKTYGTNYQSRSFLRLQDISLSYQLNPSVVQSIGFEGIKLYMSGKNIFTLTNWDGWDPATGAGLGPTFPTMKSYTLGIDISI